MVLRKLYSSLVYLATPLVFCRFLFKGLRNRSYLNKLGERFGFVNLPEGFSCDVWFHAVSVGEVKAIKPVIKLLKEEKSQCDILITTTTPTGFQIVKNELKDYVVHAYFPLDIGIVVDSFLKKVKPSLVVIVETEIWPNLFLKCAENRIPVILVNARLSPRSMKGYKRILPFVREVLNRTEKILARSQDDAERFLALGVDRKKISVCGNIKFDMEVPEGIIFDGKRLKKEIFGNKTVWIAASTHEGEEDIVLKVYKDVLEVFPNCSLILAPRHPERVGDVLRLCNRYGLKYQLRTSYKKGSNFNVFVVDTLGELLLFYSASDFCFVGGSLVEVGGHNLLEPASLGIPIISGRFLFNFEEVRDLLLKEEAIVIVDGEEDLKSIVLELLNSIKRRSALGERAKKVFEENKGSSYKVLSVIKEYVKQD